MISLPYQHLQDLGLNIGQLAVNTLSWYEFMDKIKNYCKLLIPYQPGILLLKIPNTIDGLALLLASSSLNQTTIIAPSYYTETFLNRLLDDYRINHYVRLENGDIIGQSINKRNEQLNEYPTLCLLSSGTTGIPKCIKHSWETLIARIRIQPKYKDCVWFSGYPITHFAGLQVVLQCLYNGGHLILPENYHVNTSLKLIQNYRPQYLNCTPTFMRQLLLSQQNFDWKSCGLKRITLGGEIVDQDIIDLIKHNIIGIGVTHIYASTELGSLITVNDEQSGFPLALIDENHLSIRDDILWAKPSSSAMLAYLDRPLLSAKDWVSTNDVVMVKGERVLFVGRQDDIINIGGYKVNPAMVEQVIRQIPAIHDVVVLGKKNPIMGYIIKANNMLEKAKNDRITKKEKKQKRKEKSHHGIYYQSEHYAR